MERGIVGGAKGAGFAALREWGLDGVRWGLGHVGWREGCFWGDWVWGVVPCPAAAPRTAPGIPLRACFARTRPLSSGTKGDGRVCVVVGVACVAAPSRASPAHCVRAPLRWSEGGIGFLPAQE